uniref:Putative secreted protein n=1 Tax=Ixodes ricinus TaxID=34613 RepID=A0A6B0UUA4_IXORI
MRTVRFFFFAICRVMEQARAGALPLPGRLGRRAARRSLRGTSWTVDSAVRCGRPLVVVGGKLRSSVPQAKKAGFGAAFSGALCVPPHKTERKLCGSNEQTPLPGLDCIRVSLYDLLLSPSRSEETTTTPAWLVACRRLSPRVWCT